MDELYKKLRNERKVDWGFREVAKKFAFVSFALNKNIFDGLVSDTAHRIKYYDELALYAALFSSLLKILDKKTTLGLGR